MFLDSMTVITALQASIAPVTMISAVGFLSLVTSNRFARVVDRMRMLLAELPSVADEVEVKKNTREIFTLYQRSKNLCIAAVLGGFCIFFTSLTIFMLFANSMFNWQFASSVAEYAFLISLIMLLAFGILFTYDFTIAQRAIRFELDQHMKKIK